MWLFKRNKEVKLSKFQELFNKIRDRQNAHLKEYDTTPDTIVLNFDEFYTLEKYFNTNPLDPAYRNKSFNDNPSIYGMDIIVSNNELNLCK